MEMIEATGKSVEDAISRGLAELKAAPADVMIEVLEEPNTGLFGFGARQARVRLVLLRQRKPVESEAVEKEDDEPADDLAAEAPADMPDEELAEDAVVGQEVLTELLAKMRIEAQVSVQRIEAETEGEETHWMLNVTGDSISRLIGRRGETLSSLQYIVRLICSRRLQRRANIIIDAGGYKMGRSNRLRGLAKRMAKQAVQQGRTITLEPMHANERRIIHLTLRGRGDVTTRSVGEGRARKVTIVPK